MGSNHSNLPPRPIGFAYMCITIRDSDTLSIILGSDHEASIIRQIIQETWPKGMQKETFELNGVYKFRLKGSPFSPLSSSSKAIACRRMAERILNRLYRLGWKLQMTSNLSQELDLATWIFKKVPVPEFTPPPFLVVGLSNLDSLMILNAPSQLHQVFKDAIEESWPSGIQNWTVDNELLSIKLKGKPWLPGGEDTVHSRVMLQAIISNLTTKQWNLYGNSNIRADSNTFFFEHNPSMVPCELPHPAHFIITFNMNDVLRVIGLPESLVPVIQSTIQSAWSKGIEKESVHYAGSYQFKLKGCPWWASGNEAVESRFLVMKLMEVLLTHGWSPITAFDSSRKWCDKRSLLFRQTQPRNTPFFCLSPYLNDKLRLINAPEDVIKICQNVIRSQYAPGIKNMKQCGNSLKLKLLGNPWCASVSGHSEIHARNMICHLISALANHGWMALISADFSGKLFCKGGTGCPYDVDSFFFIYEPAVGSTPPIALSSQMS